MNRANVGVIATSGTVVKSKFGKKEDDENSLINAAAKVLVELNKDAISHSDWRKGFEKLQNEHQLIQKMCQQAPEADSRVDAPAANSGNGITEKIQQKFRSQIQMESNKNTNYIEKTPPLEQRIEQIKSELFKRNYTAAPRDKISQQQDRIFLANLINFSLYLKPIAAVKPINKNSLDIEKWQFFCHYHPEYNNFLTPENQNSLQPFNINGLSGADLCQQLREQLKLAPDSKIFIEKELNPVIIDKIYQQQIVAQTKIASIIRGTNLRKLGGNEVYPIYPLKVDKQKIDSKKIDAEKTSNKQADDEPIAFARIKITPTNGDRANRAVQIFKAPDQKVVNGPSGSFKVVTGRSSPKWWGRATLKLEGKKNSLAAMDPEILMILDWLGIKNIFYQFLAGPNSKICYDGGIDLEKALESEDLLVPPAAFAPIIATIEKLHQHGVVHRDIKLANILFQAEESRKPGNSILNSKENKQQFQLYLTDFESMVRIGPASGEISYFGTPDYCPDELLQNANQYGINIDKICLLNTLANAYFKKPQILRHEVYRCVFISLFVKLDYQKKLNCFLLNPKNEIPELSTMLKLEKDTPMPEFNALCELIDKTITVLRNRYAKIETLALTPEQAKEGKVAARKIELTKLQHDITSLLT